MFALTFLTSIAQAQDLPLAPEAVALPVAEAAPSTPSTGRQIGRAATVGGLSLAGAVGGGAAGYGLEVVTCVVGSDECAAGRSLVAGVGVGAVGGAALGAVVADAKVGRVTLGAAIPATVGLSVAMLADDTASPLWMTGVVVAGLGAPVVAGGLAATEGRGMVTASADVRPGYQGLRVAGRF